MKDLTSFVREGLTTTYKLEDIDIDEFKKIAEKIGNDKNGLGSAVAQSKSKIVNSILGRMFNKTSWSVELQFKSWDRDISEPIYDDGRDHSVARNRADSPIAGHFLRPLRRPRGGHSFGAFRGRAV